MSSLSREAKSLEHPFLHVFLVDTKATATQFITIQNNIVGNCTHLRQITIQMMSCFFCRQGEWVVGTHITPFFFRPLKHWPVYNPEEVELAFINQALFLSQAISQSPQGIISYFQFISYKKNQVFVFKL